MSSLHFPSVVMDAVNAVANARPQPSPTTVRIMIVDDEPVNIKVVRKYLQIAGYTEFITTPKARARPARPQPFRTPAAA